MSAKATKKKKNPERKKQQLPLKKEEEKRSVIISTMLAAVHVKESICGRNWKMAFIAAHFNADRQLVQR